MRTSFIMALLAATAAIVPTAASARDQRGDENRGDRGQSRQQIHAERQQQIQQARPAPEARPQVRAERPNFSGDRGDRPNWQGRPQVQPQGQPQFQPRPQQPPVRGDAGAPANRRDGNGQNWRQNGGPGGPDGQRPQRGNDDHRGGSGWEQGGRDGRGDVRGNEGRRGNDGWRGNEGRHNDGRRDGDWRHNGGGRDWNRSWHNDRRYDWRTRRDRYRSYYHLPRYYAPYGWDYGYRRFGIGFSLSSILFEQNYWIDDPEYYGLPPAYGPYRWVRYYNDALLVDIYSGRVVDTVYDIFW